MDIHPISEGHALVVPRVHEEYWTDLDSRDAAALMACAQQIGKALQQAFEDVTGVNLLAAGGKAAGQEICHAHIHVIPRRPEDGIRCGQSNLLKDSGIGIEESANQLRTVLE